MGPASPAIIAYFAMAPKGGLIAVLPVFLLQRLSLCCSGITAQNRQKTDEEPNLEEASAKMREMKTGGMNDQVAPASAAVANLDKANVNKIVFACDKRASILRCELGGKRNTG